MFECGVCHKCFRSEPALGAHKVAKDHDLVHCIAPGCSAGFVTIDELLEHEEECGHEPYECPCCDRLFSTEDGCMQVWLSLPRLIMIDVILHCAAPEGEGACIHLPTANL